MTHSTPSAVLLLHASAWAGPVATAGDEVAAEQVAEMLLAAAFLANEQVQGLELELTGDQELLVHPGEDVPDWPADSLEHQVWMQMALGENVVAEIVYGLIKQTPAPAQQVVQYVAASPVDTAAPLDDVSGLLRRVSEEQPAKWALLFKEIRLGLHLCRS